MKILSAIQTKALDKYTIDNEPISSLSLMERAALAFCEKYVQIFPAKQKTIKIFCGLGNNGGDGLAIGRILYEQGYKVEIFILEYSNNRSVDFTENLAIIPQTLPVYHIFEGQNFPEISHKDCIIDAIFGSGLSKPLEGFVAQFVQKLNGSGAQIVAVDIPSGLFMDMPNEVNDTIVQAQYTISFQLPKLAFVLPEKAVFCR